MIGPHDHSLRSDLARRLRELREAADLTQAELAERLGARQSFVSKYEAGERRLDVVEFRNICRAVGASFDKIATDLDKHWETLG